MNVAGDLVIPTAASPSVFVRPTALSTDFVADQAAALFTVLTDARFQYIAAAPRRALIACSATFEVSGANSGSVSALCIDKNGDTVGQSGLSPAALAAGQMLTRSGVPGGVAATDNVLSTYRVVDLVQNDVLGPTFGIAYTGTPADSSIQGFTFAVLLL